jgi:hypothetical protein
MEMSSHSATKDEIVLLPGRNGFELFLQLLNAMLFESARCVSRGLWG